MEEFLALVSEYEFKSGFPDNLIFQRQLPEIKANIIALWNTHMN